MVAFRSKKPFPIVADVPPASPAIDLTKGHIYANSQHLQAALRHIGKDKVKSSVKASGKAIGKGSYNRGRSRSAIQRKLYFDRPVTCMHVCKTSHSKKYVEWVRFTSKCFDRFQQLLDFLPSVLAKKEQDEAFVRCSAALDLAESFPTPENTEAAQLALAYAETAHRNFVELQKDAVVSL